ncbi:MAG: hypothetical protein M1825_005012 [Sarcosagium campestre]|nr:MAG: hypothetical protein M1825_005012 [Sarcosagium campestre]
MAVDVEEPPVHGSEAEEGGQIQAVIQANFNEQSPPLTPGSPNAHLIDLFTAFGCYPCSSDDIPVGGTTSIIRARPLSLGYGDAKVIRRGKVGRCARDLVRECGKCEVNVCRNCIHKPSASPKLPSRLRRLCPTCIAAPLALLTLRPPATDISLTSSFTSEAFLRTPCNCCEAIWLCRPCGISIQNKDIVYRRVWAWRTRYSTFLGGLGTGIGEGTEGVKCARGEHCFGAQDIDVEFDCDGEDMAALLYEDTSDTGGRVGDLTSIGYHRQEIEGIGGVVRKKIKKRIRVGAVVEEYDDEREKSEWLGREARGEQRSWCGWCARVVPVQSEGD